ncbi:hypothetical protein GQ600_8731 [Phytophthora cactorum]|nr:hypothetical protein GQ600_8731 [Phytophthora cactorum]
MHKYRDGPSGFLPSRGHFSSANVHLGVTDSTDLVIWKNRPNGSLEDEEYTYDLDGEKVAFGDKVYTELVSSDPIQLGCPFRSLYAGFERNWSIYKPAFHRTRLTIFGAHIQDHGSDYSSRSNRSGLRIPSGENVVDGSSARQCFMGFVVIVHCLNMAAMVLALAMGVSASRGLIKSCLGWLLFSDTLRGFEDGRAKNIIPHWDVDKEAKHRVWQSFLASHTTRVSSLFRSQRHWQLEAKRWRKQGQQIKGRTDWHP